MFYGMQRTIEVSPSTRDKKQGTYSFIMSGLYWKNCSYLRTYLFIIKHQIYTEHLYLIILCLYLCLYPINIKTAEPIGFTFFMATHVTQGKLVYEPLKLNILARKKCR